MDEHIGDFSTLFNGKFFTSHQLSASDKNRLMMKEEFREALIQHMDVCGVSAGALAKATGISKPQIDKLRQRAVVSTNVADAIKLAAYFGKTVEEFVGREPDPMRSKLLEKIAKLSPDEQEFIAGQLEALVALRRQHKSEAG